MLTYETQTTRESAQTDYGLGFQEPIRALILGARGGVGEALASMILASNERNRVILSSRYPELSVHSERGADTFAWLCLDITHQEEWPSFVERVNQQLHSWGGSLNLVINATGLLHRAAEGGESELAPERSLASLNLETMTQLFAVNTFGVALALRFLTPLFPRAKRSLFVSFSARVGSIGDNRIGGWYSYRASKAAQNMLIKTAAIELARTKKDCVCVSVHPGTVATPLSAPFTKSVKHHVFSASESAAHLMKVFEQLTTDRSGECIAWDGTTISP